MIEFILATMPRSDWKFFKHLVHSITQAFDNIPPKEREMGRVPEWVPEACYQLRDDIESMIPDWLINELLSDNDKLLMQHNDEYEIDKNLLSKRYKNYQFLLHPDHHYGRTKEELSIITANSGIINSLYNTLIDDKKRAEYLFKIRFTRYIYEKLDSLETLEDKNKLKAEIKSKIDSAVERIGESFHSNVG
eukprot:XP_763339.1 hypothetical protein [Theileria parva strain Muguga]